MREQHLSLPLAFLIPLSHTHTHALLYCIVLGMSAFQVWSFKCPLTDFKGQEDPREKWEASPGQSRVKTTETSSKWLCVAEFNECVNRTSRGTSSLMDWHRTGLINNSRWRHTELYSDALRPLCGFDLICELALILWTSEHWWQHRGKRRHNTMKQYAIVWKVKWLTISFVYLFIGVAVISRVLQEHNAFQRAWPRSTEKAPWECWEGYEKAMAISPKEKLEGSFIQLRATTGGLRSQGARQTEVGGCDKVGIEWQPWLKWKEQ